MDHLHDQSAVRIAQSIACGEITARQALEHFLERIDRLDGPINAIVHQDRAGARARADAADRLTRSGAALGPLHGVPKTVKESFQIAGTPTTFGLPAFKDRLASRTALAIDRLAAAGANIFGKTNVPVMLADFQSYNDVYGTTRNPWDLTRTCGGSSGGSAAALAAGLTGLEFGSDIGGSLRNPAHFCGVFSHKPTWNLVPPRGHALGDTLSPVDLSVVDPMARSALDLEAALRVVMRPDAIDPPGLAENLPVLTKGIRDLRIGVWLSHPVCPTSEAMQRRLDEVAATLSRMGAAVIYDARPDFDLERAQDIYHGLLLSSMAGRMSDAIYADRLTVAGRAGSAQDADLDLQMARLETMRHRDWGKLNEARTAIRWAWRRYFDTIDFLIVPVMPTVAFRHDHSPQASRTADVDGVSIPYHSQTFWAGLANVAYLPATVFPAGTIEGLPVGFQILGPAYADLQTIQFAQTLERLGFGFTPPPIDSQ